LTFFEEQLEQGIFQICYCKNCDNTIWPPKEICHMCHKETVWRKSENVGKIIEFSRRNSTYFGIIEIDNGIKLLGEISCISEPIIGQSVKMNISLHKKPHYSFIVENN